MKTKKSRRNKHGQFSKKRRIFGLRYHHFGGLAIVIIGVIWSASILVFQPSGHGSADATCTISATLVDSCRPWLGAASAGYGVTGFANEIANHESRIGRQLDVVHDYRTPGETLSADDKTLASRANTYLMLNWKPDTNWGNVTTGADDSSIDAMASSISSLGSKKIFLSIFHEPENDVSGGDSNCTAGQDGFDGYKGSDGTPAQYVAMWQYVENRMINTDHVSNVVWVMTYIGYPTWNCMVKDLWPGNSYVDWVTWDPYIQNGSNFNSTISSFYDFLGANSNSTDDFDSKTWGINEWGDWNSSQSAVYNDYAQAKAALDNNTYPRIKLWDVFDEPGSSNPCSTASSTASCVGYAQSGAADSTEQADYNAFADDPHFTDAYYEPANPPPDTMPPTVSLTSPANNATVSGTITVSGNASDNVGVSKVELYIDGSLCSTSSTCASDTTSPYNFPVDTTKLSEGTHSLYLEAFDAAGNHANSATVTITVKNQTDTGTNPGGTVNPGGGTTTPSNGNQTTTTITASSSSSTPVPVKGTLVIAPTAPGQSVSVTVDGKSMTGNAINTGALTNGTHTLMITENGKTVEKKIVVHNPWPTALKNELEVNKAAYSAGAGTIGAVAVALVWVFRRKLSFWLLKHIHLAVLKRFGLSRLIRFGLK